MFHHFHDSEKHITAQGSISAEDFSNLIDYYGRKHHILSADIFLDKSRHNLLSPFDVCISFDDGLLCQYDVAYPVLEQKGIKAFWFIYTSPMAGEMEKLEVYRHFRFSKFNDIEEFYAAFFKAARAANGAVTEKLKDFDPDSYLRKYPFYTPNDKRFRYLRDKVLGEKQYNLIMDSMLIDYHYDIAKNAKLLWIKAEQIRNLHDHGHVIGLHSHTHPTVMNTRSFDEQMREYRTNKQLLESIIQDNVVSVSYPCNSYNEDTLRCMRDLGVQIGFRANMSDERLGDVNLEYPREDHANIIKMMRRGQN